MASSAPSIAAADPGRSRERRDYAGTRTIVEADDEPLASVAREMARALAADGVLVAWHADGRAPAPLFVDGTGGPRMLVQPGTADDGGGGIRWETPGGGDAFLTIRMPVSSGSITLTLSFRRIGAAARMGVRNDADRMLPMIQGFFRLWSLRADALSANRGLTAALDSSDVATLLVDSDGRLVFANAVAERMLGTRDGLRRTGTMLGGHRPADTMRLQASIERVAHGGGRNGGRETEPAPVVALARRSGRPLLAAIVSAGRAAAASEVAAIVHVFDPDRDLEPLLAPVCRLYALSPVEGRLASLLARGVPLIEAAKAMRVQEQTARSYLKQVFLKTDTNRQAELVWLMLTSAVRTAPECPTRLA